MWTNMLFFFQIMKVWGKRKNLLFALEFMKSLKYFLFSLMQSAERLHLSLKKSFYNLTYLSVHCTVMAQLWNNQAWLQSRIRELQDSLTSVSASMCYYGCWVYLCILIFILEKNTELWNFIFKERKTCPSTQPPAIIFGSLGLNWKQ